MTRGINSACPLASHLRVPSASRGLGGGGYNPWTPGRCRALIWGTLINNPIPDRLPPNAEAGPHALRFDRAAGGNPPEHWFTTRLDQPREGPIRDAKRPLTEERNFA